MIAHSMKSNKERLWALTEESPIHEVKKNHEGPKSQKEGKERNDNNNKEKRRGSRLGQRTCSKKNQHQGPRILMCPFEALRRGPWLTYGKAKVYVQISSKNLLKKSSKIRYYLCNPWSKPVGSRVDSKGEVVWSVGE